MTNIITPIITSINFETERSRFRAFVSSLNQYYYLGGARVTIFDDNKIQQEKHQVSWFRIALKIISYVLFIPITCPLFILTAGLRVHYHLKIIKPAMNANVSSLFLKNTFHSKNSISEIGKELQKVQEDKANPVESPVLIVSEQVPQDLIAEDKNPVIVSEEKLPIVQQDNVESPVLIAPTVQKKHFGSNDLFAEVQEKSWYADNQESIQLCLILIKSIGTRVDRRKFDNDFVEAKASISEIMNDFPVIFEGNDIQEEVAEFKQILIEQLEHLEVNQHELIEYVKKEQIEAGIALETHRKREYSDSEYGKILKMHRYENYALRSGEWSVWTQFSSLEHTSDSEKFHISLFNDLNNISGAFDVVFPILNKYKIASFKVINTDFIGAEPLDNLDGKEFTIYIQKDESDPDLWSKNILPEILSGFKSNNIQCGTPSKADIPIPGANGFVYTRSPQNCLGFYTPAAGLELSGFSNRESATISESKWLNIKIDNAHEIPETKIKLEPKNQRRQAVSDDQINFVSTAFEKIYDDNSFFNLIAGWNTGYLPFNHSEVTKLVDKFGTEMGSFFTDKVYKVIEKTRLKREIFDYYLQPAARITAQLRNYYGIETPVGKILPALYLHFVKNGNDHTDHKNDNAIIRDLVLCGLRNGSVFPAIPVEVDEELLNELIEKELRN